MTPETKAAIRECAKAVCRWCKAGYKYGLVNEFGGYFEHVDAPCQKQCDAVAIRARFPEAFEETE